MKTLWLKKWFYIYIYIFFVVVVIFKLGQNISHQMKAFKTSSLHHHVHLWQTTLFVTRTFSSILFHHGTEGSFTGWSSFAAGLIQFAWRASDPSLPRSPLTLVFSLQHLSENNSTQFKCQWCYCEHGIF